MRSPESMPAKKKATERTREQVSQFEAAVRLLMTEAKGHLKAADIDAAMDGAITLAVLEQNPPASDPKLREDLLLRLEERWAN